MVELDCGVSSGGADNSSASDQIQFTTLVEHNGPVDGDFDLPSERYGRDRFEQDPSTTDVGSPSSNRRLPALLALQIPPDVPFDGVTFGHAPIRFVMVRRCFHSNRLRRDARSIRMFRARFQCNDAF